MSLLARLDRALLRRHQRNCPWPTGSGAITTRRVGGYPSGNKRAAEMKPPPANITRTKGATMARDERAGVASETEPISGGELHRRDSESLEDVLAQMRGTQLLINERVAAIRAIIAERDAEIAQLKALRSAEVWW